MGRKLTLAEMRAVESRARAEAAPKPGYFVSSVDVYPELDDKGQPSWEVYYQPIPSKAPDAHRT